MIEEIAEVVEVGRDYLRVSAQSQSACGKCAAAQGCGQGLLNRWGAKAAELTLPLNDHDPTDFQVNDKVLVGIAENLLVRSALLLYLLPLLTMVAGVVLGNWLFVNDLGVALMALVGLIFGGLTTGYVARLAIFGASSAPVLLGKIKKQGEVSTE